MRIPSSFLASVLLAYSPLNHLGFGALVVVDVGAVVHDEQLREVEAMHELRERAHDLVDAHLDALCEGFCAGLKPFGKHVLLHARDPAIEDERERTAFGAGFGRHVADELLVGGKTLAVAALQATLGGEVGIDDDEVAVHRVVADGLQQKALSAAVLADDEAKGSPAIGDDVDVVQQGVYLGLAPDGDVGQADTRHDTALEGVEHGRCDALGDLGGHGSSFRTGRAVRLV